MEIDELPIEIKADCCYIVEDAGMMNNGIFPGDFVFIDLDATPNDGDICAVDVKGQTILRRVYAREGSLTLLADDYRYRPMCFTGEELGDVKVIGVAVCVNHRLNTKPVVEATE